ncbi:PAS domain-containing protein [Spirosoma soli]|uniref:histidine kinase n=1 Tax=Spirosoma soli TaxID=1770529 RepID=A0ABW5M7T3_9BACT
MNTALPADSLVPSGYLQHLLEAIPTAVIHLEAIRDDRNQLIDFNVYYSNTAGATIIGNHKPEAIIGKRWTALSATNSRNSALYARYTSVFDTGEPIQFEQRLGVDGDERWFEVSAAPYAGGVLVTFTNITARKQAEQNEQQKLMAQSQADRLQAVINAVQISIHLIRPLQDKDGEITDFAFTAVNPAFADTYTKVAPSALLGQAVSQWFPGYREEGLFGLYRQVYISGQPERFDIHYTNDGFNIWVDAKVSRLGDEILVTHTDYTALKQAELEIQLQNERLKFVTDSALTAIGLYSIIRDPDTHEVVDLRYELINGRAEQMTQRKADELIGHTMRQVFPGIERTGIWSKYKQLAETGEPLRYHNHYNYDGYDLWYEVQGVRKGELVVLSFLDITELKLAQEYNQQQAREFQQVLDNALTAISHFTAVRDESGQVIDFIYQSFNHTSEQFTGLKAEDIVGKRMLELFPGVRTSGVFDRWVQLMETGETMRFQDKYQFDGFDFWFDTQAVKWEEGFIQSYIDITPIKQAELAQQKQAELLNTVLDATLTSIACYETVRDETGRIVDFRFILANHIALEGLNMTTDELYGKTLCEVNPLLCNSPVFQQYVTVVETGQSTTMERPVQGRWYFVSVVKFGDGILTSSVDITENHNYRQQIEAANVELVRSNENLESFAYVASHDLQEPLRKIESFGDLLMNQYAHALDQPGVDMIGRMQAAAQRMSALIRDLLSYSRITTQKWAFQPHDLNLLIADVLGDLETTIQEKQAQIDVGELPTVMGDGRQLRQLFQNLLSNALKFVKTSETADPAIPQISVSACQVARESLPEAVAKSLVSTGAFSLRESQPCWAISVTDNGIGFAQSYAERIFGTFQRLHGRNQYPGTGIGLAIVKKVVENHGGVVTAQSQPEQGATFTVYLPAMT